MKANDTKISFTYNDAYGEYMSDIEVITENFPKLFNFRKLNSKFGKVIVIRIIFITDIYKPIFGSYK